MRGGGGGRSVTFITKEGQALIVVSRISLFLFPSGSLIRGSEPFDLGGFESQDVIVAVKE